MLLQISIFYTNWFHSIHAMMGTTTIVVCLMHIHFPEALYLGYELAAWYWHFVQ